MEDKTRKERIENLISQMTLEEKISQLVTSAPAIERLGIESYRLGGECLHGLCNTGNATLFPMPIGMGATFDTELIGEVATATSDEARAKFHDPVWANPRASLLFYTPVINICRDARWGRGQETYGEDPVLNSLMGASYVRGLQGNHPKYLKVAACAKHLAVQSGPESIRQKFDAIVSRKDLVETYLPAFEALAKENVATVMATYNRVNGEHCCASKVLIQEFLRGKFGFKGMVVSDGGALGSLHNPEGHDMTKDAVETAGLCLKTGCDMEIGEKAYPYAAEAIDRGLITEVDIDLALSRIFKVRFDLGEFDSDEDNPYTKITKDVIQCEKHIKLARKVARKSIVLLKNNGILPFTKKDRTLLVTGPNAADIQVLLGNFYRGMSGNLYTILEGITKTAPEGTVVSHMQGCLLTHENVYPSDWAFGLSDWADAVVAVVGYTPLMEGEEGECIAAPAGGDKDSISIPENQLEFLRKLKARGKPIVTVVTGGSPLDLREVHELSDAVVMAWYPGEQGGLAVGDILFGNESPSGKLPITFPKSIEQIPEFTNYDLEGRTYRYMKEEPMYPFGFGLSYSKFEYSEIELSKSTIEVGEPIIASITVENVGKVKADEVVQLYLTDKEASVTVPNYSLKAMKRITLEAGGKAKISLEVTSDMMHLVNLEGEKILESGTFAIQIGGSLPDKRSQNLGAGKTKSIEFEVK